jgi:hypothetical protein
MVYGGLHTLPAVSSPVTLNAPSWPFSYAVGPSVVAVVFTPWRYAGVCVLDCGTLKLGTLYQGVAPRTAYYPAGSLPWRTPYPPASFSFLSSPSFLLSAGHSAILGNDVVLWGRNGAGGRAACPPWAHRTWAAYAPGCHPQFCCV